MKTLRPRFPWAVSQDFSDFNVHMNLLGSLLRCRLRFCRSRMGPEMLHFQQAPRPTLPSTSPGSHLDISGVARMCAFQPSATSGETAVAHKNCFKGLRKHCHHQCYHDNPLYLLNCTICEASSQA